MSNDISRFLQQPTKHYSGVRMQQGRVLLDSDFNEQSSLDLEDARHAFLDLIGPEGSPDQGYTIGEPIVAPQLFDQTPLLKVGDTLPPVSLQLGGAPRQLRNVSVRAGSMFVGGMRFDQDRAEALAFQRDYLQLAASATDLPTAATGTAFRDFYYLHAWEQPVSALEDQELREAMLRGPDTSFRIRRMRRVEVIGNLGTSVDTCDQALDVLLAGRLAADRSTATAPNPALRGVFDQQTFELKSKGRLRLAFQAGAEADTCGPCDPDAQGFLGTANTTLRIMLTDTNRFVWALDNAAPLFRVKVTGLDAVTPTKVEIEMLTPPGSEAELPLANRVVEILPFEALLDGGDLPSASDNLHARKIAAEVGVFARVSAADGAAYDPQTRKFQLSLATPEDRTRVQNIGKLVHAWPSEHPDAARLNAPAGDNARYFFMRLWHQATSAGADIELTTPTVDTAPALADTGIVPVFEQAGRRGDFWIATLRLDAPRLVTPLDLLDPGGVPPHGPRHFYAPLALVHGGTDDKVLGNSDCRSRLRRVNDRDCTTCTVGDGVESHGEFLSIQEAIDALPSSGGRVSIRPGVYQEQVRIERRRDVVLEGCGAATVIETPPGVFSGALVDIQDCEGIALSGLTLHAVEQAGVAARRVTELTLGELSASAGLFDESGFRIGSNLSESPLFDLNQVGPARIDSVIFEPARRPSVVLTGCEIVTMSELTLVGSPDAERAPSSPMLSIVSSELVTLVDSTLHTFGQVAVSVRGSNTRDVELRGLNILSSAHESSALGEDPVVTETRSAVDIDDGEDIRLLSSQLTQDGSSVSEHAAVVVHGRTIVIERNTIEAQFECHLDSSPPLGGDFASQLGCEDLRVAFGGIQVRGGSSAIEIRRNRIFGGLGHGITLGSVDWHLASSPVQRARHIAGAGAGQIAPHNVNNQPRGVSLGRDLGEGFEDDNGRTFLPVSEGPVRDIVIAENRIEGMLASGISVLTVFGLIGRGGEFIDVENARIESNAITKNLRRPGLTIPDTGDVVPFAGSLVGPHVISVLPFGGIVLGTALQVDIRNNIIQDNVMLDVGSAGTFVDAELLPINGIFILNGEGINIAGNRILNNGKRAPRPEAGTGGGIDPITPLRPGVRAGIAVMLAGTGLVEDIGDLDYAVAGRINLSGDSSSLRVSNNTVVQPEGRALHAVATGPLSVDGNFLSSQGNHGADIPTDRFAFGDVVFIQNLGAPWEASDLESHVTSDTRGVPEIEGFDVAQHALPYLRNTELRSPRFFIGTGGGLLFNNNQVIYDWDVRSLPPIGSAAPLSFFPSALLGLDHVAVNANHFAMRIANDSGIVYRGPLPGSNFGSLSTGMLLAGLFVIGATIDVSRNRVAETVSRSMLSLLTVGEIMNITTLNQTTHDNVVLVTRPDATATPNQELNVLRKESNQVLFVNKSPVANLEALIRNFVQSLFFRMLRDPGR